MGFWSSLFPSSSRNKRHPHGSSSDSDSETSAESLDGSPSQNGERRRVWIALMGVTGAGKSTFISHLVDEPVEIGHALRSCTDKVKFFSFTRKNTTIFLVDTPGFDDSHKSDVEVLQELAHWLKTSYEADIKLDGIIYLHRITDPRMQGSASKNLRMFKFLCGEDYQRKVVLATTRWEEVRLELGEEREKELQDTPEFWGSMVKRGSKILRHHNTTKSAKKLIDYYILAKQEEGTSLAIQNEMVDDGKALPDTEAGKSLDDEISNDRNKLGKERNDTRKLLQASNEAQDDEASQELERHLRIVDLRIRRLEEERNKLAEGLREYEKNSPLKRMLQSVVAGKERKSTLQKKRDETDRELQELKTQKKTLRGQKGKNLRPSWTAI